MYLISQNSWSDYCISSSKQLVRQWSHTLMTLTMKLLLQPPWVISPVFTLQVKSPPDLGNKTKLAEDVALSQSTTTQNGFLGAVCLTIMWLLFRQRSSHAHTYQQFRGASKVMDVLGAFEGKPMLAQKKKKPLVMWHQPARIGPKTTTFASTPWIIENSTNLSLKRLSPIQCKAFHRWIFFFHLKVIFFTFNWGPVTEEDAVYSHAVIELHNGRPAFQQHHQQLLNGRIVQHKRVPKNSLFVIQPAACKISWDAAHCRRRSWSGESNAPPATKQTTLKDLIKTSSWSNAQ